MQNKDIFCHMPNPKVIICAHHWRILYSFTFSLALDCVFTSVSSSTCVHRSCTSGKGYLVTLLLYNVRWQYIFFSISLFLCLSVCLFVLALCAPSLPNPSVSLSLGAYNLTCARTHTHYTHCAYSKVHCHKLFCGGWSCLSTFLQDYNIIMCKLQHSAN